MLAMLLSELYIKKLRHVMSKSMNGVFSSVSFPSFTLITKANAFVFFEKEAIYAGKNEVW